MYDFINEQEKIEHYKAIKLLSNQIYRQKNRDIIKAKRDIRNNVEERRAEREKHKQEVIKALEEHKLQKQLKKELKLKLKEEKLKNKKIKNVLEQEQI